VRPDGQLADQSIVCVGVTEHPAGSVDVEDHGQGAVGVERADDASRNRAGRTALDGDPLLVDVRLGDFAALDVVDGLAALGGGQLEQVRRVGGGFDERLSGGLEGELVRVRGHR
jgi:hypothetical protein